MRRFQVGTRGSALALWQTRHVTQRMVTSARAAARATPEIAERIISTRGDVSQAEKLAGKLEKGFFTEELEHALRTKEIDWAVHSLKDLPTRSPQGLTLAATLERVPAHDLLLVRLESVGTAQAHVLPLKPGAKVGSSSLRREAMLRRYGLGCAPVPLRGNVPTRVEKLRAGQYDAVVLAWAGVSRLELDLSGLAAFELNPRRWPCAPGQGAVAVQCREDDAEVKELLSSIADPATSRATSLERDFLRILEGGCTTPFGCYVQGDDAWLGIDTPRGWRSRQVKVPAAPQLDWFQKVLDAVSNPDLPEVANDGEWLSRRI